MSNSHQHRHIETFNEKWKYFVTSGTGLLTIGIVTLSYSIFPFINEISLTFLGAILIITGVFVVYDTFQFWWSAWITFLNFWFSALLYMIVGTLFIFQPIYFKVFTLAAFFFLSIGIARVIFGALSIYPQKITWVYTGVVDLLFALLIFYQWVPLSLEVLGVFVGIDLLVSGATRLLNAMWMPSKIKSTY